MLRTDSDVIEVCSSDLIVVKGYSSLNGDAVQKCNNREILQHFAFLHTHTHTCCRAGRDGVI